MTDLKDMDLKVFDLFKNRWALATAGSPERFNSCTIGWGSLGTLWATKGRSGEAVTVYLHPSRYTCAFFKENDFFTVSFFPEEYKKALGYMGSHSRRDGDKPSACGLTPKEICSGNAAGVTYEEAELTFLCRKLYQHPFAKGDLAADIQDYYANAPKAFPPDADGQWQPHWMFIGEIVGLEDRR